MDLGAIQFAPDVGHQLDEQGPVFNVVQQGIERPALRHPAAAELPAVLGLGGQRLHVGRAGDQVAEACVFELLRIGQGGLPLDARAQFFAAASRAARALERRLRA